MCILSLRLIELLHEKDVLLDIADAGVPLNDVRQPRGAYLIQLAAGKIPSIEEPVTCPAAHELIDENRLECFTDNHTWNMILNKQPRKQVNIVHTAIQFCQLCRNRGVRSNLRKACLARQSQIGACGIEIGQAMVAAALDVERNQIEGG